MSQGCVTWGVSGDVSGMCQGCVWGMTGVCNRCVWGVSGVYQGCVWGVSGVCQGCSIPFLVAPS